MAMKNFRRPDSDSGGSWLTTYSDMVTLLLCFFVLLFSFSIVSESKLKDLIDSFKNHYGVDVEIPPDSNLVTEPVQSGEVILPTKTPFPTLPGTTPDNGDEFEELYLDLKKYIAEQGLEANIEIEYDGKEINIRFKDAVLFDPDSAVLRSDGKDILSHMCVALKGAEDKVQMMRIEGHTASRPAGQPQFKYTFEMSVQRAVNVLKYMRDFGQISPFKLSAVGYGQYHPIDDNETEEGRIRNRRVEIIISKLAVDSQ